MFHLFRLYALNALFFSGLAGTLSAQTKSPGAPPLPPIPARLDVVTFQVHNDGEDHKLVVMPSPRILRVDAPTDGFSLIYHPSTQYYIGLENRNYTYWEFSWPAVRFAVESTKRYEDRLHEVGSDGLSASTPPSNPFGVSLPSPDTTAAALDTNSPAADAPSSVGTDDSGYVWHTVPGRKKIAGMDCSHWIGESVSNEGAEAWCYAGQVPAIQTALAELRVINEPMALVPVRNLVPPLVFQVNDTLVKGGNTPLLITWGDDSDKNRFELLSLKSREGRADLFTIPKLYVKTTLVTMDGIGDQKPPGMTQPQTPEAPERLPRPER